MSVILFGKLTNINIKNDVNLTLDEIMSDNDKTKKKFEVIENYYIFDRDKNTAYNIMVVIIDRDIKTPGEISNYAQKYVKPLLNATSLKGPCAITILICYFGSKNNLDEQQKNMFITELDSLFKIMAYLKQRNNQYVNTFNSFKQQNITEENVFSKISTTKLDKNMILNPTTTAPVLDFSKKTKLF